MDGLTTLGRWIVFAGFALLVLGSIIWAAGRLDLPLGRLPGDIRIQREGFTCFAPIATSLLLSVLLTLLLNLILRQMR
jgi:hypothetical protein